LSFADGHAEYWKWQGISTELPVYAPIASANDYFRVQRAIAQ
jgi:hypothetical protein